MDDLVTFYMDMSVVKSLYVANMSHSGCWKMVDMLLFMGNGEETALDQ